MGPRCADVRRNSSGGRREAHLVNSLVRWVRRGMTDRLVVSGYRGGRGVGEWSKVRFPRKRLSRGKG